MSKPKLELQINIPTTIRLLNTEPVKGVNSYGPWFLYNVECGGQEYSFFAAEKVVQILKQSNVSQEDEVIITKKIVKNGKKNFTDYDVNILENKTAAVTERYQNNNSNGMSYQHNGNALNGNGNALNGIGNALNETDNKSSLSRDYPIMLNCMTEAMLIRDELGHDVDVNKLGITLFLRKVKP